MSTAKEIQAQATGSGVDIRLVEASGAATEHSRRMTDLLAPCRVPKLGTQAYELLRAMKNGERLTVARALSQYRCYALSQRCGELRREYGWPIKSEFIVTAGAARVKVYWLE